MSRMMKFHLILLLLLAVSLGSANSVTGNDVANENFNVEEQSDGSKKVAGVEMVLISGGDISDFWIGQYEVTQKLYTSVMGNNKSFFKGDNLPVEQVSWFDAVEFCNRLSKKTGLEPYYNIDKINDDPDNKNTATIKWTVTIIGNADGFRLPTSAEWELAARGNSNKKKFVSEYMDEDHCWFRNNSEGKTHPVGRKKPNANGIYDICGNVWEWCFDWHPSYYGLHRIIRDGHYNLDKDQVGYNSIDYRSPHLSFGFTGIRLARNK